MYISSIVDYIAGIHGTFIKKLFSLSKTGYKFLVRRVDTVGFKGLKISVDCHDPLAPMFAYLARSRPINDLVPFHF